MAKAFLNISSWPFFFLESCQNLGKTLRKNNYSSEIYQVKPGYTIQKPANQLATQVNWMISIKPNPILEIFRTRRTHQSLSDLRINKQDDDREMMTMQWKWLMVISMEVLGNHQIYSNFAFISQPENNKKTGWHESIKLLDIWKNQNGRIHAHQNGRK